MKLFFKITSFLIGVILFIVAGIEFYQQRQIELDMLESGLTPKDMETAWGQEMAVFYIAVGLIFMILAFRRPENQENELKS